MTRSILFFILSLVFIVSCFENKKPPVVVSSLDVLPEYKVCRLDELTITLGEHLDDIVRSIDTINIWKRDEYAEEYLFPYSFDTELSFRRLRSFKRERNRSSRGVDQLFFLDGLLIAYNYAYSGFNKSYASNKIKSKFSFYENKDMFFIPEGIETLKTYKQEYEYKDYSIEMFYSPLESRQDTVDLFISIRYKEEILRSRLFQ